MSRVSQIMIGAVSGLLGITTIQALIFTTLLGAGGGWLTVTGKYPSWGAGGAYFEFIRKANSKQKSAD